jgi:hypothetical protein
MVKVELSENCTLYHGDCLEIMKDLKDISACVTDPPYHLSEMSKRFSKKDCAPCGYGKDGSFQRLSKGFMGQEWDGGDISFRPDTWKIILETLLPGAHLLSFAGTRTYHRIACAIEDAGFEVRDMISWLYGSGFPKSHNISKAIDKIKGEKRQKIKVSANEVRNPKASGGGRDGTEGATRPWIEKALECGYHEKDDDVAVSEEAKQWEGWGTALKPACEPICLARKPLSEKTIADNVLIHNTGAINIDDCRVELSEGDDSRLGGKGQWNIKRKTSEHTVSLSPKTMSSSPLGRWPANVIHDGSEEVIECFPESKSSGSVHNIVSGTTRNVYGKYNKRAEFQTKGDSGSVARFFYCAKASSSERDYGLKDFEDKTAYSSMNTKNGTDIRFDTPYELIENTPQAIIEEIYKYIK